MGSRLWRCAQCARQCRLFINRRLHTPVSPRAYEWCLAALILRLRNQSCAPSVRVMGRERVIAGVDYGSAQGALCLRQHPTVM